MCDPILSVIGLVSVVAFGLYCLYKLICSVVKLGMVLTEESSDE